MQSINETKFGYLNSYVRLTKDWQTHIQTYQKKGKVDTNE
jgi:hypothetical protein